MWEKRMFFSVNKRSKHKIKFKIWMKAKLVIVEYIELIYNKKGYNQS